MQWIERFRFSSCHIVICRVLTLSGYDSETASPSIPSNVLKKKTMTFTPCKHSRFYGVLGVRVEFLLASVNVLFSLVLLCNSECARNRERIDKFLQIVNILRG